MTGHLMRIHLRLIQLSDFPRAVNSVRTLNNAAGWLQSVPYKIVLMANLTLIYGMRLLPEGEVAAIEDAKLKLANGHEAHVTMHTIEGSREEIETQLKRSLDAFFDFYPEL